MQDLNLILNYFEEVDALKKKNGDGSLSYDNIEYTSLKKKYLNERVSITIRIIKIENDKIDGGIMPEDKLQMEKLFEVEERCEFNIFRYLSVWIYGGDLINTMNANNIQMDDILKVNGTIAYFDEFILKLTAISEYEINKNTEGLELTRLMVNKQMWHRIESDEKKATNENVEKSWRCVGKFFFILSLIATFLIGLSFIATLVLPSNPPFTSHDKTVGFFLTCALALLSLSIYKLGHSK